MSAVVVAPLHFREEHLHNLAAALRVEVRRRLIEDDDVWVVDRERLRIGAETATIHIARRAARPHRIDTRASRRAPAPHRRLL